MSHFPLTPLLTDEVADFKAAGSAELRTLTADVPWVANSREAPQAVKPVDSVIALRGGKLELELRSNSVLRVRICSTALRVSLDCDMRGVVGVRKTRRTR